MPDQHEERDCEDRIHRIVGDRVSACKEQVYVEIHALRGDISKINDRLNTLSEDVHKLGIAVRDIANNSGEIAKSLKAMQEVAATYNKVLGWWDVTHWLRKNIVTVGVVVVVLYYVILHGDAAEVVKHIVP